MAEISIIVPVYKVEPYLCRCVDSILLQSFRDFDLILIDDGSPDQCGNICESYAAKDSRIHVIHQKNGGLSAARNTGIEWSLQHSTSKWLTFVDSDDWIHPEYLEVLYKAAIQNKAEIAIGEFAMTYGEELPEIIEKNPTIWRTEDYYLKKNMRATVAWGKLFFKRCFKSVRFPVGKIHEDEYVLYRILFQYQEIPVVEGPVYAYFQNESGIMKRAWNVSRLDAIDAFQEQVRFFLDIGHTEIAKSQFLRLVKYIVNCQEKIIQSEDLSEKEKKYYCRRLKRELRRLLVRYRKYQWLPFKASEWNKQIYTNAFTSIRICRNLWGQGLKPFLKKIPFISGFGKKAKSIYQRTKDILWILRYRREILFKKVIILQSPLHGNMGDHAIAKAEAQLFDSMKISYCDYPWTQGIEKWCAMLTPQSRLIVINGGGYLGQLWKIEEKRVRAEIEAYRRNRIIIFPQTIFFDMNTDEGWKCFEESKKVYESHPRLTVFLREKKSFNFMKENMPKVHVELVPDVVMMLNYTKERQIRQGVMVCLRDDLERTLSPEDQGILMETLRKIYKKVYVSTTIVNGKVSVENRNGILEKKLSEFMSVQLVVTDRLHGMIFAAITETPCIVINSLSHKIKGCYEWLKELDYIRFVDELEEIPVAVQELRRINPHYPKEKMEPLFEPLREAIRDSI